MTAPRILLSFARDSSAHEAHVRRLWELLRAAGVDASYDSIGPDSRPDWTQWMEDRFADADVVLVVASPLYRTSAANSGPAGTRNVRYEASLVRQAVYRDPDAAMRKFVPVLLPGCAADDIPAFLWPRPPTSYGLAALTPGDVAPLAAAVGRPTADLRHELSLRVTVSGGEVACRADLSGTALGTRTVPMPYGADQVWDALALPPGAASSKLHGFGRRLSRVLLDEPALRTVAALVDAPGSSLDVVVETEGLGLALPYELIRLADDRVLATIPSVRFTRRLTGVWRAPTPPSPGPLAVLAEVIPAERDLFGELSADTDGPPAAVVELAPGSSVGDALAANDVHVLHLSVNAPPAPGQMPGGHLARALRDASRPPALVVLWPGPHGALGTVELAASLVRQGADRVLAMHAPVSDGYRVALSRELYRNLGHRHMPVAEALGQARSNLAARAGGAEDLPEYAVATLLSAAGDPPVLVPGTAPARPTEPAAPVEPQPPAEVAAPPVDDVPEPPPTPAEPDEEGRLRAEVAAAQDRAAEAPQDLDRLRELAVAYSRVGDFLVESGERGGAEPFYREGMAVTRLMMQLAPDDRRWQHDLSLWFVRLGQLLVNSGRIQEGEGYLRQAEAMVSGPAEGA